MRCAANYDVTENNDKRLSKLGLALPKEENDMAIRDYETESKAWIQIRQLWEVKDWSYPSNWGWEDDYDEAAANRDFVKKNFLTADAVHEDSVLMTMSYLAAKNYDEKEVNFFKESVPFGNELYAEAYEKRRSKCRSCKHYMPTLDGDTCALGAKTLGEVSKFSRRIEPEECENCPNFKSRFIEFPLTINGIEYGDMEPWDVRPCLVSVRPCGDKKTYLGIYLGEMPHLPHAQFDEESKILKFCVSSNPCIFVPALKKVVWGCESWWSRIESEDELKEITDEAIEGQFYVQMLKAVAKEAKDE